MSVKAATAPKCLLTPRMDSTGADVSSSSAGTVDIAFPFPCGGGAAAGAAPPGRPALQGPAVPDPAGQAVLLNAQLVAALRVFTGADLRRLVDAAVENH